ncbi:MAG: beta-ketoacyl-[acyl-carrier-protein] synthase family protein [Amycolatopsis sp.]|jgi:3-oxoacyl-[acyl-carrier-protein] synthase II|uniref:beta-ketoacyl-[acyl-carrier-protein] synthase family protein n=1 Tax=Amycolatopsis sp. TaxID=37632 RepID=UPI0026185913|nr:beta-ketoacyl-[acyl-carrier-protein] synthase family protein [Amycolatopsis sp.]MCU1679756.1 beta-ketoacyl-[acyl-carrier-protein] synthase family protein [Amycolatopsis sp.]
MMDVVVTGLGATTPLGGTATDTWKALLDGVSGVITLPDEWAAALPARLAARMAVDPMSRLERVEARRLDRSTQAAVVAAREAWQDAELAGGVVDPDRVAVVMGTGIGGVTTLIGNKEALTGAGYRRVSPRMIQMTMPNGAAAAISIDLGARAGANTLASACASGAEALAHGLDLIRFGRADVVIAGGTEACVDELTMAGFAQARAMSARNDDPTHASRPFDKARDGFVLGEGAAVLVLERATTAAARGRRPYAVLAGAGITSDAYDMVAPDPTGAGQVAAMRAALADAGLGASDVAHVNAHATSTPGGDMIEARAIGTVFGHGPVVSATKAMTGHLLGASGALEALVTALSVRNGVVPPTPTLDVPEDDLDLDVTRSAPRRLGIDAALSNSFGFGGHNAALVFTKAR